MFFVCVGKRDWGKCLVVNSMVHTSVFENAAFAKFFFSNLDFFSLTSILGFVNHVSSRSSNKVN